MFKMLSRYNLMYITKHGMCILDTEHEVQNFHPAFTDMVD